MNKVEANVRLADGLRELAAAAIVHFGLDEGDLPATPQQRKGCEQSFRPNEMKALLHRGFGLAVDQLLCGSMALLHRRHARSVSSRAAAEKYFAACAGLTRAQYFASPARMESFRRELAEEISWLSPAESVARFPGNGRARVTLFPGRREAPTVILLHSLSLGCRISDVGAPLQRSRLERCLPPSAVPLFPGARPAT